MEAAFSLPLTTDGTMEVHQQIIPRKDHCSDGLGALIAQAVEKFC